MTPEARELFLTISRCPVMAGTLRGDASHCRKVVLCQTALEPPIADSLWQRKHHLPEPWVGDIERAQLLFLSSNPYGRRCYDATPAPPPYGRIAEFNGARVEEHPSLERAFEAPKAEWSDAQLLDKAATLFKVWAEPKGTRLYLDEEKTLDKESPYWSAARCFAESVLHQPVPGSDYALMEIVRCKSPEEEGVEEAAKECVPRYLDRTLELSPAPVVVVMGRSARQVVRRLTGFADYGPVSPPLPLGGQKRTLVFLAHPSSRGSKYRKKLNAADTATVASILAVHDES